MCSDAIPDKRVSESSSDWKPSSRGALSAPLRGLLGGLEAGLHVALSSSS